MAIKALNTASKAAVTKPAIEPDCSDGLLEGLCDSSL
jgi:hypothetical protein